MKKIFLFIAVSFWMLSCSSDDDGGCDYYYTGETRIEYNKSTDELEYFVYVSTQKYGGDSEGIKVAKEVYQWIHREKIKSRSCFAVNKYRID